MSLQPEIAAQPAEPGRYRPKNKGMAAHLAAIAAATFDPITRDLLRAAVPQVARMEQALDELVIEAAEEAAIEGAMQ
jgi:hypothetical protein